MAEVRIRVPKTIKKGDTITVRALVPHPMEIIQRGKDGKVVEKGYNYIHTVRVSYNGKEIMNAELTQAISANPVVAFQLKADAPGTLEIAFEDTTGAKHVGKAEIKF
ncbi:MAG: thiosulfate oxidation carrier complex protein SoxZ [Alphaproteobacteria bacterium]|nr:thiosulfate oxidation carrier complex protein SoxZ [Alphaproteobacteria bacterium]